MSFPIATTIEAASALIGVISLVFGGAVGLGKLSANIEANTKATNGLASIIDDHLTWSWEQVSWAREKFMNHDVRITGLEDREKK